MKTHVLCTCNFKFLIERMANAMMHKIKIKTLNKESDENKIRELIQFFFSCTQYFENTLTHLNFANFS